MGSTKVMVTATITTTIVDASTMAVIAVHKVPIIKKSIKRTAVIAAAKTRNTKVVRNALASANLTSTKVMVTAMTATTIVAAISMAVIAVATRSKEAKSSKIIARRARASSRRSRAVDDCFISTYVSWIVYHAYEHFFFLFLLCVL